jgi:hypothetical protein
MAINPDFRLKVRRFFRKNKKILIVLAIVILVLTIINRVLISLRNKKSPTYTYTPHTSVLDSSSEVPEKVSNAFEDFIESYVGYCNNRNYVAAYNMISEDCKKNFFDNNYDSYVDYVQQKFDTTKRYAIQNYSNYNDKYIYNVKLFDDYLATGLTGQTYKYQEEKMTISYDENNELVVSVGNYIESNNLKYMASNDYLKVEVTSVIVKYSFSIYKLKFTNRTNYTIAIQDGRVDTTEIGLIVNNQVRGELNNTNIVLAPGQTLEVSLSFEEFYDSNLEPSGIILDSVRVMENYTEDPESEEEIENEINNAIDKFSMTIAF